MTWVGGRRTSRSPNASSSRPASPLVTAASSSASSGSSASASYGTASGASRVGSGRKPTRVPSLAVDVTPYPVVWDDRERQTLFAGYVLATAKAMGVSLRWGGDWDSDTEVRDNGFDDLVHFEIVE